MTFDVPIPNWSVIAWWQWALLGLAAWYPLMALYLRWDYSGSTEWSSYSERIDVFWIWVFSPVLVTFLATAAAVLLGGNLALWAVSLGLYPLPWDDWPKEEKKK